MKTNSPEMERHLVAETQSKETESLSLVTSLGERTSRKSFFFLWATLEWCLRASEQELCFKIQKVPFIPERTFQRPESLKISPVISSHPELPLLLKKIRVNVSWDAQDYPTAFSPHIPTSHLSQLRLPSRYLFPKCWPITDVFLWVSLGEACLKYGLGTQTDTPGAARRNLFLHKAPWQQWCATTFPY